MSNKHLTDQRFSDLNLHETLQKGLIDAGFEFCTPIQAESLPFALAGDDVAGQAQTGTGKTVAFLLAGCQYMLNNPLTTGNLGSPRCVILSPTRELAIQIHEDAKVLLQHSELTLGLVYGGTPYEQQKQLFTKRLDILIGTPGRFIDLYKQKFFDLDSVQVLVLDEADRMFDLGFIKDIRYLMRRMPNPEKRLNLLFSATLSYRVQELSYEHMNDPKIIKVQSTEVVADKVLECAYYPANDDKLPLLVNLIKQQDESSRSVIFVNTRYAADMVSRSLSGNDISNGALSGDVPQNKREKLLGNFKDGQIRALVATDVAARGLHIPEVSHVYNFDLPQDAEDYVHRIGRTARAGASGVAISFVCEQYAYSLLDIEEYIGHSLDRSDVDATLLTPINAPIAGKPRASKKKTSKKKTSRSKARTSKSSNQPQAEFVNQDLNDQQSHAPAAADVDQQAPQSDVPAMVIEAPLYGEELASRVDRPVILLRKLDEQEAPEAIKYDDPLTRFSRKFGEIPAIG